MADWTEIALQFMGDGQSGVFPAVDRRSGGEFSRMNDLRKRLLPFVGKIIQVREIIDISMLIDRSIIDFCRPFGQLRYFTGLVPDLPLELFKDSIQKLELIFQELVSIARDWNAEALGVLTSKRSPTLKATWKTAVNSIEARLRDIRSHVKASFQLESRIQSSYQQWDQVLAQNIRNTDSAWISLRALAVEMKRDGFSDLDAWRNRIRLWGQHSRVFLPGQNSPLASASSVLENYCKLKHLQKVMSLW